MSKVREFFTSLNKSTKITLISCGCFVALTVVILCFFVLFPISPSDTIQEKYGREAKASKSNESSQTVTTQQLMTNISFPEELPFQALLQQPVLKEQRTSL